MNKMKYTLISVCCALLSSSAVAGAIADALKDKRDQIAACESDITGINQDKVNAYNEFIQNARDVFNKNQDSTNLSLDQGFTDHALSLTDGMTNVHTLTSAAADDINSITRQFNNDIINLGIGQTVTAVKQLASSVEDDTVSSQSEDLQPIDIETIVEAINDSITALNMLDKDL